MIATIRFRGGKFLCSNCWMEQDLSEAQCPFCGATLTNWEETIMMVYNDIFKNDLTSSQNCDIIDMKEREGR